MTIATSPSSRLSPISLPLPRYPRIERAVRQVHDQVDHHERHREQERLARTSAELARVQQENAELAVRARRLEAADPAVIEDLARRKLEMLKPGEVLFIDGTPAVPTSAPAVPR